MLSYIRVGANDVPRSGRFYAAVLMPLGYTMKEVPKGFEFTFPEVPGGPHGPAAVYVGKPFDGEAASVGNGSMIAFRAQPQETVRNIHASGLEADGSDEGAPGFRAAYGDRFYVGYLRDPMGNKLAIFCINPAEGTRGG